MCYTSQMFEFVLKLNIIIYLFPESYMGINHCQYLANESNYYATV